MKNILSITLLLSFLIVNISQSIILVNYEINKKEITDKYCVNKDKPQMHCCGKCYLKKKLAQQAEQQKLPSFPDIKIDIQFYSSQKLTFHDMSSPKKFIPVFSEHKLYSLFEGTSVFHPPSC